MASYTVSPRRVISPPSTVRRLKAAAGAGRTGVRVAQQTPHNLVDRSGAVLAARVAAAATCLFAEELRPPHQITVAGSPEAFDKLTTLSVSANTAVFSVVYAPVP